MNELSLLTQNTENWLSWRRAKIGSSDAPIILGVSPWSTPRQLFKEKLGLVKKEFKSNKAIDLGNRFEPAVRAFYELETGIDAPATILIHKRYPFLIASLDGYSKEHNIVVEIKVAGKEVFDAAKSGVCHEKYYPQVQHQLEVSGANECHFVVANTRQVMGEYFLNEIELVVVKRDEEFIKDMLIKELGFYDLLMNKIEPPLHKDDVVELEDVSSVLLFKRLKEAIISGIKEDIKEVKEEAVEHVEAEVQHTKVSCSGVSLSKNKNGVWSCRLNADEKNEKT